MSQAVAHRGPDAQGLWLNHQAQPRAEAPWVGLAHRRLSILDPQPRSNQPFEHPAGYRLIFNGEIYNYRVLRQELAKIDPGYPWQTDGDTEVLLQAYALWGDACFARFDGMFAAAIWDPASQQLTLARDRMGQKPLYWASADLSDDADALPDSEPAVAFASEPAALNSIPWINRSISQQSLSNYLMWGYIAAPRTIWHGMRKLSRASILHITRDGAMLSKFDTPATGENIPSRQAMRTTTSAAQAAESTRKLLLQAVRRQMVSDTPIGCFLSGGIDSSAIAWCMTQITPHAKDVQTFSIGFTDPRYDESPYAQQVAQHLGTTHHLLRVTPDATHDLPQLARIFGEPFGDSSALPTLYLSRFTRQQVKVALSGDGGDELFGGYDRYRALRTSAKLEILPASVRHLITKSLLPLLTGAHPKSRRDKLRRFVASLNLPAAQRYASYIQLIGISDVLRLLPQQPDIVANAAQWIPTFFTGHAAKHDIARAAMLADHDTYLPEDLFTKVDRTSMSCALEVRSPLMDPDVVNFSRSLPTRLLMNRHHGKLMFRAALSDKLPPIVWNRPKMGFAIPIGQWLSGPLRNLMHDTLMAKNSFIADLLDPKGIAHLIAQHERGIDQGQRLFALLMLQWWGRSRSE